MREFWCTRTSLKLYSPNMNPMKAYFLYVFSWNEWWKEREKKKGHHIAYNTVKGMKKVCHIENKIFAWCIFRAPHFCCDLHNAKLLITQKIMKKTLFLSLLLFSFLSTLLRVFWYRNFIIISSSFQYFDISYFNTSQVS
jgi:hypothetical protein